MQNWEGSKTFQCQFLGPSPPFSCLQGQFMSIWICLWCLHDIFTLVSLEIITLENLIYTTGPQNNTRIQSNTKHTSWQPKVCVSPWICYNSCQRLSRLELMKNVKQFILYKSRENVVSLFSWGLICYGSLKKKTSSAISLSALFPSSITRSDQLHFISEI